MNRLLRAFWDRLLPPGGDVAVAREPDDREGFVPGAGVIRTKNCSTSLTPRPRRLADERPGPADLDRHGRCWWWWGQAWVLHTAVDLLGYDDLWLPYWAIANPGAKP